MSEAWGTVIAAIIAVLGTLVGIWLGYRTGRRQTTDQAAVEHQQWLREQRRQAFATYLAAWDDAQLKIMDIAKNIDQHTAPENFPHNYEEEMTGNIDRLLGDAVTAVWKPYEQLMLIAPQNVTELVDATSLRLFDMSGRLRAWVLCGWGELENAARQAQYQAAVEEATGSRADLFQASRAVLLSPPAPGGR